MQDAVGAGCRAGRGLRESHADGVIVRVRLSGLRRLATAGRWSPVRNEQGACAGEVRRMLVVSASALILKVGQQTAATFLVGSREECQALSTPAGGRLHCVVIAPWVSLLDELEQGRVLAEGRASTTMFQNGKFRSERLQIVGKRDLAPLPERLEVGARLVQRQEEAPLILKTASNAPDLLQEPGHVGVVVLGLAIVDGHDLGPHGLGALAPCDCAERLQIVGQ